MNRSNCKLEWRRRFAEVFPKTLDEAGWQGFVRIVERAQRGCSEASMAQTAYILATAYWESALTLLPVREGLAKSDAQARQIVQNLFDAGRIQTNYALPAENGQSFYGRGYVQLTWEKNYRAIGDHLVGDGTLFYEQPDRVLEPDLAAIILVRGMVDGIFSEDGSRLNAYINRDRVDFLHARQTVNRMDRAEKIADWADRMHYVIAGTRFVSGETSHA